MDSNTEEPYLMVTVGDLCLVDVFFCGCPRDSYIFNESDLTNLTKKEYCISTYWEETPKPASTRKETHKSPHPKENVPQASSPFAPDSMSTGKPSCKMKHLPQAKEQKDKWATMHPPCPRTISIMTKATNATLRRMAAVPPAKRTSSMVFPQL